MRHCFAHFNQNARPNDSNDSSLRNAVQSQRYTPILTFFFFKPTSSCHGLPQDRFSLRIITRQPFNHKEASRIALDGSRCELSPRDSMFPPPFAALTSLRSAAIKWSPFRSGKHRGGKGKGKREIDFKNYLRLQSHKLFHKKDLKYKIIEKKARRKDGRESPSSSNSSPSVEKSSPENESSLSVPYW